MAKTKEFQYDPKVRLNPKQQKFVFHYIDTGHASNSARLAGYSSHSAGIIAANLLSKAHIRAFIDEMASEMLEDMKINSSYFLQTLFETIEDCKKPRPMLGRDKKPILTKNDDGDPEYVTNIDSAGVLKGLDILGRYFRLYGSSPDGAEAPTPNIDVSKLNKEQLEALGRGIAPKEDKYNVDL
jgi:hypothetical protein